MIDITRRNRRAFLITGVCATTFTSLFPGIAYARTGDPKILIEDFHNELFPLLSVSAGPLSASALSDTVNHSFHMRLIARIVAGDAWKSMDAATKQRLTDAILSMNVATYMHQLGEVRLTGHGIDGVRDGEQKTKLVDATLTSVKGEMPLTYVTREISGRWWIIDVLIERKYSELSLRQAEYQGVIRQSGIDGLIATLETKAAQLAPN